MEATTVSDLKISVDRLSSTTIDCVQGLLMASERAKVLSGTIGTFNSESTRVAAAAGDLRDLTQRLNLISAAVAEDVHKIAGQADVLAAIPPAMTLLEALGNSFESSLSGATETQTESLLAALSNLADQFKASLDMARASCENETKLAMRTYSTSLVSEVQRVSEKLDASHRSLVELVSAVRLESRIFSSLLAILIASLVAVAYRGVVHP